MDYKNKYHKYKSKYLVLTNATNQIGSAKKNIFDKIKIVGRIGAGMQGQTYLVKLKNEFYILKRQKISNEQYNLNNMNNQIYRELKFYRWIDKLGKNKIFFMKMLDYRKYYCDSDAQLKNNQEYFKDYKYCLELVLEKKDHILNKNINLLTNLDLFDGFVQCLNIIRLMHKFRWIHSDTKADNIAFNKFSSNKKINIKDYGIINSQFIFSLIDYGSVINVDFNYQDPNLNKITKININYDLYFLIEYFLLNNLDLYKLINSYQHKKNNMFEIISLVSKDKDIYDKTISYLKSFDYNIDIIAIKDKSNLFYRILAWEFLQVLQLKFNDYFYEIINKYYKTNAKPKNIVGLEIIFEIKKNYMDYTKIFQILQKNKIF